MPLPIWFRRAAARRRRSILIDTAGEQISRINPGDWHADRMLHGELAIISGVLATIAALVDTATAAMTRLSNRHGIAASTVTALQLQIAQLPDRQHLVAPAPHQRRRRRFLRRLPRLPRRNPRRFVSKLQDPEQVPENAVYGDAISTAGAIREAEQLDARIRADIAAGQSRHDHHVSLAWQRVTRVVLLFDVVALSTLTIKLLNVPVQDVTPWRENPVGQLQLLVPAVCFALFAALVIAVAAHLVGEHTWRYIHRISPLAAATKVHKRSLVAGWAGLAVFSSLMGLAILVRLHADANGTSSPASVVWCVALLIGFAGVFAPLAVAMVDAWHSSPEVQRRAALARIVEAVNHDRQALTQQVCHQQTIMTELLQHAERLLADTKRRVDTERLPAHQAILILRARHGYAQEHATPLAYPQGNGFRVDAEHGVQLGPLEEQVERMRHATASHPLAATPAGEPTPPVPMTTVAAAIPEPGTHPNAPTHNGHPALTG